MSADAFDRLEDALRGAVRAQAARRAAPRGAAMARACRGRGGLLAAAAALVVAGGGAVAATQVWKVGAPDDSGLDYCPAPRPDAGAGVAAGAARILPLRVADPGGGPPWALRVFGSTRGGSCVQVGQVVDGRFGRMEGTTLRPVPAVPGQNSLCGYVARDGYPVLRGLRRLDVTGGSGRGPVTAVRTIRYGLLGPAARVAVWRDGSGRRLARMRVDPHGGAYLFVRASDPAPYAAIERRRATIEARMKALIRRGVSPRVAVRPRRRRPVGPVLLGYAEGDRRDRRDVRRRAHAARRGARPDARARCRACAAQQGHQQGRRARADPRDAVGVRALHGALPGAGRDRPRRPPLHGDPHRSGRARAATARRPPAGRRARTTSRAGRRSGSSSTAASGAGTARSYCPGQPHDPRRLRDRLRAVRRAARRVLVVYGPPMSDDAGWAVLRTAVDAARAALGERLVGAYALGLAGARRLRAGRRRRRRRCWSSTASTRDGRGGGGGRGGGAGARRVGARLSLFWGDWATFAAPPADRAAAADRAARPARLRRRGARRARRRTACRARPTTTSSARPPRSPRAGWSATGHPGPGRAARRRPPRDDQDGVVPRPLPGDDPRRPGRQQRRGGRVVRRAGGRTRPLAAAALRWRTARSTTRPSSPTCPRSTPRRSPRCARTRAVPADVKARL